MNTNDIKLFIEVTQSKSTIQSANNLGYEQFNISKRIKKLEQELGRTLFIRSDKGMELTEAGHYFIKRQLR